MYLSFHFECPSFCLTSFSYFDFGTSFFAHANGTGTKYDPNVGWVKIIKQKIIIISWAHEVYATFGRVSFMQNNRKRKVKKKKTVFAYSEKNEYRDILLGIHAARFDSNWPQPNKKFTVHVSYECGPNDTDIIHSVKHR